jgi:hypothetical protein
MTSSSSIKNKTYSATEEALSEVSKLLSRLAKSRKAPSKLQEIISLTGVVARLSRSLQGHGADSGDGQNIDGYGDKNYISKISARNKMTNLVR